MREIHFDELNERLKTLIKENNPLEKDIGVIDENGQLVGVFITSEAYDFFLKKIEEEEDRMDIAAIDQFRESGEKDQ